MSYEGDLSLDSTIDLCVVLGLPSLAFFFVVSYKLGMLVVAPSGLAPPSIRFFSSRAFCTVGGRPERV